MHAKNKHTFFDITTITLLDGSEFNDKNAKSLAFAPVLDMDQPQYCSNYYAMVRDIPWKAEH